MVRLSLTTIRRIMKDNSEIGDINPDAVVAMRDILEEIVSRIVPQANLLARHAGRKRLWPEDIKLAYKRMKW